MPPNETVKNSKDGTEGSDPRNKDISKSIFRLGALFDSYRTEQKKNREQDTIEKNRRILREWATLIFLILTTAGVFIQACILNSTDQGVHEGYIDTQRPFIAVKNIDITYVDGIRPEASGSPGIPQQYWKFVPVWENSGNTLTKGLKIYSMVAFTKLPATFGIEPQQAIIGPIQVNKDRVSPDPEDMVFQQKQIKTISTVLSPHSSTPFAGIELTPEFMKATEDDRGMAFIMEVAIYSDIFKGTPRHQTKFCFAIGGLPTVGEQKPTAGHCAHWNCTDEECADDKGEYLKETQSNP